MSFSGDIIDLECPVCLHRFHDPIILNCGHTIDRSCIQKMIIFNQSSNPTRQNECPTCSCTFDPEKPLISNKSLTNLIKLDKTFEWFFIDISSQQEATHVLKFLKLVFDKRNLIETNHITIETDNARIQFTSGTNFDQQLQIKPLLNLEKMLQEACAYLQQQNGVKKICILTDGLTKHCNLVEINSNIINQRFIIHIGDKNIVRTRQLADQINFQFGHFNEKTLEIYVQHFITNF